MNEGEKPKFPKLIKEESMEVTDQKNILLEIEKFYSILYKANAETFDLNLNEHMSDVVVDKLTDT